MFVVTVLGLRTNFRVSMVEIKLKIFETKKRQPTSITSNVPILIMIVKKNAKCGHNNLSTESTALQFRSEYSTVLIVPSLGL